MRLRKFIFTSCAVISCTLFICGIVIICFSNTITEMNYRNKTDINQPKLLSQGLEEEDTKHAGYQNETRYNDGKHSVNLIVFGLDDEQVRSDVILILNFNPERENVNILSVARDTRVTARGKKCKINALIGMGGEKLAIQKIEKLTGIDINYYITMNFKGFRKIVDELDGVEVDVPFNMNYDDPDQNLHIHLRQGLQMLNGEEAEQFVRYRKGNKTGEGYTDGDIGRIRMQQEFIKAFISQKLRLKYFSKTDDIFQILRKYVKTNVEIEDVNYYLNSIMNIKYDETNAFTIPGESVFEDGLWYFVCDREKTKQLVNENFKD